MFTALFDHVPDALLVVDRRGCIVAANAQAEVMFGYSPGSLDGMQVEQLMPADLRELHGAHTHAYMQQPRMRPMGGHDQPLTGQRRDGTQFPVEIALSPFHSEGQPRYLASIRDVSETRRVQQALIRARYDTLLARIGQLAVESGDDESAIQAVPTLLAGEIDAQTVALLLARPGGGIETRAGHGLPGDWDATVKSLAASAEALWESLAGGVPLTIGDPDRLPEQRPAIALAQARHSGIAIPLLDREQPMGVLIVLTSHALDHDALHLLQSAAHLLAALLQRRRSEEQLAHAQRLEAIGQLTGGIAHDFNNLLTVMSGSLQLLELEYAGTPEAVELIASALRSVARGAELTGKLLAFARRQRLHPQPVAVDAMLHELERMLARTLGEPVRILTEVAPGLPLAWADPGQLETALVNLALNARDAMPRGGELTLSAARHTVSADTATPELPSGEYLRINVADTGHGMDAETLARAIEPFFTTKDSGRGSGLGLSMVYGFVKQSGGLLRFDSELGYGTRVDLLLPAARADARPAIQTTNGAPAAVAGECILVVEDEAAVRTISAAFLTSLGYRVLTAADADQALRLLAGDAPIDLLFSDVMLGRGLDGHELAAAARQHRPGLPILLTSGYDDSQTRPNAGQAAAFELLRKPFRREQLAASVRRALDRPTNSTSRTTKDTPPFVL